MTLKQFGLFAGQSHYARGGWCDFKGSYLTFVEAKNAFTDWLKMEHGIVYGSEDDGHFEDGDHYFWYHIINFLSGQIVDKRDGAYCGQIDVDDISLPIP